MSMSDKLRLYAANMFLPYDRVKTRTTVEETFRRADSMRITHLILKQSADVVTVRFSLDDRGMHR